MATADQLERQALARAAAAQQAYLNRAQSASASGGRVSPDTITAGTRAAGLAAGGTNAMANQKPWALMTKAEQKAALDKVDWNSPFFQQGSGGGGSGGSGGNKPSTPSTPSTSTPAVEVPKTIMPVDPSPAPVTPPPPTSNVDQTAKMYAEALAELQRQYGVSQENILASIGRMKADPYNTANAYAAMQLADPRVAANPVAEYMAAAGMAPGQAAAAQQMAQAEADAYQRAMQNVQNIMSTSQQQANLSRLADIGLIETGATQDLESNLNMLRLGLEKERLGALTGLQQRNLENDLQMRNAIASQIANIFSGQDVAPESILKLIEAALAKINTNRWTTLPAFNVGV